MDWIKRNLFFAIGAVLVLAVIGAAGFHHFRGAKQKANEIGSAFQGDRESGSAGREEAAARDTKDGRSEIARLTLRCRAVLPSHAAGDAETTIAYALQRELQASTNLFNPLATQLGPEIHRDQDTGTFTFNVTLALKRPVKL